MEAKTFCARPWPAADLNIRGMPREGVGASHDAKGHLGPPKFDAAKFTFSGGRLEMKIAIQYL
jgi:uncharacterized protein (DUF2141 family)